MADLGEFLAELFVPVAVPEAGAAVVASEDPVVGHVGQLVALARVDHGEAVLNRIEAELRGLDPEGGPLSPELGVQLRAELGVALVGAESVVGHPDQGLDGMLEGNDCHDQCFVVIVLSEDQAAIALRTR